jgi:hypothetical protein
MPCVFFPLYPSSAWTGGRFLSLAAGARGTFRLTFTGGGVMAHGIKLLEEKIEATLTWVETTPGDFSALTNIGPIHVVVQPPHICVRVKSPDNPAIKFSKKYFSMKDAAEGLNSYLEKCGVKVIQVLPKKKPAEQEKNTRNEKKRG